MREQSISAGIRQLPLAATCFSIIGSCLFLAQFAIAQQPLPVPARATSFFGNKQYNDAIKVLLEDLKGRGDSQCGKHYLMLGECYHMTGQNEAAWSNFVKAEQNLPEGRDRILSEYRLAICAFKLNDLRGSLDRIDAFLKKRPDEPLVGKLLAYKMLILSRKGAMAEKDIVALHEQIQQNIKKYDYATGMEADQILCDFYRKTGREEQAQGVYARIVQNFRQVISELRGSGQPVPAGFEKSHDNAALQLGVICLEKKQAGEAVKWLENVRYDPGMVQKARLLLARAAYERADYNAVLSYLSDRAFLDAVPAGSLRSDMHLLLGLAEKNRPGRDVSRAEQWLKQVEPGAKGFAQSQAALADMYREAGLIDSAVKAYQNVVAVPDHAPGALFHLGSIYLNQATNSADEKASVELCKKAAGLFSDLFVKYPLSPFTKRARDKAEILAARGIDVSFSKNDEDNLRTWQKTAQEQKGSMEGAHALMSIVRMMFKSIVDEKTGRYVKAPNYAVCASACDRLLDENTYSGKGFDEASWKSLKGEAYYYRGLCEIASVARPAVEKSDETKPVYVENALPTNAIVAFTKAKELIDPKQLDLVKGIELGLLESLFKSDSEDDRLAGEKKFQQMEADYGTDQRFQKLALDLAEWYKDRNRFPEAAKQYAGVADRGKNMAEEDLLKLRYTAGALYSKAAYEAEQKKDALNFAIYIYPKEVVEITDDIRKTYSPLGKTIQVQWQKKGKTMSARDALVAISKAAGIPFVWIQDRGNSMASYLNDTKLTLTNGLYTVNQALDLVLDPVNHRLVFDIGLTGAKPTIERPAAVADDPEAQQAWKVIEVYDARQGESRFKPLTRNFGAWRNHFWGKSVLLYTVFQKLEEAGGARILWADGIEKQDKLAVEYKQLPGIAVNANVRCGQALESVLQPLELKYRIVPRQIAADYYEAAKDQFNKIRQVNPKTTYGERSLFSLALNYYNQREYDKMKVILREYLKLFDNPSHDYYRQACFWVGWAFENEKRYREACDYYARATEERLVLYKPGQDEKPLLREQLRKQLSYDSQFALGERAKGILKDRSVAEFADFIRLNGRINIRLEPSAQTLDKRVNREEFKDIPVFDLLCETLEQLGLSFRVENMDPEIAERAYYRMASAYKKDNLMPQALENCNALLSRYPDTVRRHDTYKLMLDIYKGLKDYRNVIATLEELKKSSSDEVQKYEFDFETGSIYFDMAAYAKAAEMFKAALAGAKRDSDRRNIREAYGKALMRNGNLDEALVQYETLGQEEGEPLQEFVNKLIVFHLKHALSKADEKQFPEEAEKYIQGYQKLPDAKRNALSQEEFVKATWIYYVKAFVDLKNGRQAAAMEKLNAVITSPDDSLAADAAYQLGLLQMEQKQYAAARQMFEYLLFATRSPESAVRATYTLGTCLQKMGQADKAASRFAQVEERYPLSPYVALIRKDAGKPEAGEGNKAGTNDTGAVVITNAAAK